LEAIQEGLAGVVTEHLPGRAFLDRNDRPEVRSIIAEHSIEALTTS